MKDLLAIQSVHQQALGKPFLLHIAPGILVTGAFLVLKQILKPTPSLVNQPPRLIQPYSS